MSTRAQAVSALAAGFIGLILALTWVFSNGSTEQVDRDPANATISDPLAEALRYIPRSAPAVAVIDTDAGAGPLRKGLDLLGDLPGGTEMGEQLDGLLSDATGFSLTDDGAALTGSPVVVSATGSTASPKLLVAWVTPDAGTLAAVVGTQVQSGKLTDAGTYRGATTFTRPGGGAVAQDGRLLLIAANTATLKTALDRGVRRGASSATGLTPQSFASRSASGISATAALVRLGVSGPMLRRFASNVQANAGQLPFLAAVDRAGIGVRTDPDGLHVRIKLRTDEGIITEADLPLAPGSESPDVTGDAPIRVGVRSPAQTSGFLLRSFRLIAPTRLRTYDAVAGLLGKYAKVDLESDLLGTLTGSATLTVADSTVTLRARTGDQAKLRAALQRLSRLGTLGDYAGGTALSTGTTGLSLKVAADTGYTNPDDTGSADGTGSSDSTGSADGTGSTDSTGSTPDDPAGESAGTSYSGEADTYQVTRDDAPIAVIALRGDILVVSSDALSDADSIADSLDSESTPSGKAGSLHAVLGADALGGLLVDRLGLPEAVRDGLTPLGSFDVTARAELGAVTIVIDTTAAG